jgi:hypothetical protein
MRTYDALLEVVAPYLTFVSKPAFRSEVANTDSRGFRFSLKGGSLVDSYSWWRQNGRRGIVLGGSFVFGVGATADSHTLVSEMNERTDTSFLNLGIRGGNSMQELISAIPFLADADRVIVCSGANNFVLNLQTSGGNELFGPFFGEENYRVLSSYFMHEVPAIVQQSAEKLGFRTIGRVLTARLRPKMATNQISQQPKAEDVSKALDRAVALHERDLRIIAAARKRGASIVFAVQPFAGSGTRTLAPQEEHLFTIMDLMQGAQWGVVKKGLEDFWPSYVQRLRDVCERAGVTFVEMDAKTFHGWSFVDRVHMNDHGYGQVADRLLREVLN